MSSELRDRYKEALKLVQNGETVRLLVDKEEANGVVIKYTLLIKPGKRPFHTLEIMQEGTSMGIQIPLIGNWQTILDNAEAVLTVMSMDTFAKVKKAILSLQQRGSRDVKEL